MLKLSTRILVNSQSCAFPRRKISALYITGDKAKENYVTLQPHLDFKTTFEDTEALEQSIAKRKLSLNLKEILSSYNKYQDLHRQLKNIEDEQTIITNKLRALSKNKDSADQCELLKEQGRKLRSSVKTLKQQLYPVEDEFIHSFLNLPNLLHNQCPTDGNERLIYRSSVPNTQKHVESHASRSDMIQFVDNNAYYLFDEAALFDVYSAQGFVRYFVNKKDFVETANPDFVRCVLIEAASATPMSNYHLVKEENLQNNINGAYLTGGAAFESYLGALTKLSIYPSVLPLRLVCCGRSYVKVNGEDIVEPSLFTSTQTNAVQILVATKTAAEADEQYEQVLHHCVDFYKAIGVPFRIVYADTSSMMPSESLRANLEVYSPALQKYISVGHLSNFGDYISKRILFNTRHEKNYQFLHLIGGPVLYTSRLIGALIENGISLKTCQSYLKTLIPSYKVKQSAIDEFKNIFE